MPHIIEYPFVLQRLTDLGLQCNYPNGGAFGFPPGIKTSVRGWIGEPDSTIRAEARQFIRQIPQPCAQTLADLAERAWLALLGEVAWVMPGSHWAYELNFGGGKWLSDALEHLNLNVAELSKLTNAAAIEFSRSESPLFRPFLQRLLNNLADSDFALAFPGSTTVCTVHHYKQLWWVTNQAVVVEGLDSLTSVP